MVIQIFDDFELLEKTAREKGVGADLRTLLTLHLTFYEQYEDSIVINIKDYDDHQDNMLVLTKEDVLVYTKRRITEDDTKLFKYSLHKEHGESTVITFLLLKFALANYQRKFDGINKFIDAFDETANPDVDGLENTAKSLRRLTDRVEDFIDLLIWLEDRKVHQVNTSYVKYDYDVVTAKAKYLLDRCNRHRLEIQSIRNDLEVKNTRELNKRIEYLSDVVKRLTAITIILMIPNIIAGHFGMNFTKPLIPWDWQYGELTVVLGSAIVMLMVYQYLRIKDWF